MQYDLVAVGRFARHGTGATDYDVQARLDEMSFLDRPVPVERINSRLPNETSRAAWGLRVADGGDVPPATALHVEEVLDDLAPEASAALRAIERGLAQQPIDRASAVRWAQERDAVSLALRIGDFPDDDLRFWEVPEDDQPLLAGLLGPQEAGLIDYDATRFPGLREIPQVHTNIHVFRRGARRMEVLNANANGVETATGTDLLYYNHHNQAVVLVQYKKADSAGHLTVDSRLRAQVGRMHAFMSAVTASANPRDFRLGAGNAAWLKVVRAGPIEPHATRLLPGMYLPAEYFDLLLGDDCTLDGRRRALSPERVGRYVTNGLFTTLVREGWIGSTGVSVHAAQAYVRGALRQRRSVVVAEEYGEQDAFERRVSTSRRDLSREARRGGR